MAPSSKGEPSDLGSVFLGEAYHKSGRLFGWVETTQAVSFKGDAGLFGCHSRGREAEGQAAINRARLILAGECLK